ncbi:hypothetical protein DFH07DRAFT_769506 [Mycena maculata]|uniref:Uncharacterized protein n=1 Tax=Mycena maculata TaxID=230809 RepID=A0AAD7JPI0_9AGAR|nr:hypothetical protein DFH07DRAFT_769506 [Mycena maculata]
MPGLTALGDEYLDEPEMQGYHSTTNYLHASLLAPCVFHNKPSPSAGITIGATLGAITLLALVLFLLCLKRPRDLRTQEHAQGNVRSRLLDQTTSDYSSQDTAGEPQSSSLDSSLSTEQFTDLQTPMLQIWSPPPSDSRPLIPRIVIPPSPPIMRSSAFDHPGDSAVNSAESDYSQISAADSLILHGGPQKVQPQLSASSYPYGIPTSDITAAACPLITVARPRRSLHPASGIHLIPDTSPMPTDAMMDLPSPFIFMSVLEWQSKHHAPPIKLYER